MSDPAEDNDLPPLPPAPPGRRRHDKGALDEVLRVAPHGESLEPLVVHRPPAGDTDRRARPFAMFFEVHHQAAANACRPPKGLTQPGSDPSLTHVLVDDRQRPRSERLSDC